MHSFHQEILDLYYSKNSITSIAKKLNKGKDFVKRVLVNNNIDIGKLSNPLAPCKYCGTTSNLRVNKRGGFFPVCLNQDCNEKYLADKNSKRVQTNLEKYGADNVAKLNSSKEKYKETCLKKYGVNNPQQNKNIKNKSEDTLEKNYGVRVPSKSKEIVDKIKQTNIEKYGFENVHQNEEVKLKAEETTIERYGVSNIFSSEIFKENRRLVNREKYGVDFFTQTDEMKNKSKQTMLAHYGVEYHSQSDFIKDKMWKTYRTNYWNTFIIILKDRGINPLFEKEEYIHCKDISSLKYTCSNCKSSLSFEFLNPHRMVCACTKHRSRYEDRIIDWLKSIGIENIKPNEKYYENGKLKFEIDVFLPDFNIGIDFHGIYWHSDIYKNNIYHQNKYKYFKSLGIQIIQIFESEWVIKEDIVKSLISNKLGKNNSIFARKCKIKEVSYEDSKYFMNENHIQGNSNASIRIGLYYNNELICLGLFGKYRYKEEDSFEIIRFASKRGFNVTGGFNRVLNYFEKIYNPKKLISFVDTRYFSGNSYSGFNLELLTSPNYFYFIKSEPFVLHSRVAFQKHKLKDKLESFDPNLSEYQNMINNGYLRIFDAGNLKFVKEYL